MSFIKKKKKKHDQIVLLAISKLNSIEVLISKALIDSVISHGKIEVTWCHVHKITNNVNKNNKFIWKRKHAKTI